MFFFFSWTTLWYNDLNYFLRWAMRPMGLLFTAEIKLLHPYFMIFLQFLSTKVWVHNFQIYGVKVQSVAYNLLSILNPWGINDIKAFLHLLLLHYTLTNQKTTNKKSYWFVLFSVFFLIRTYMYKQEAQWQHHSP